jgi:hypothetical protein
LLNRSLKDERRCVAQLVTRRSRSSSAASSSALALQSHDPNATFAIERKGVKRLSVRGSVAVAVRRCASNVAAWRLGSSVLEDISGQTVARCEVETSAACKAYFQEFHLEGFAQCADVVASLPPSPTPQRNYGIACLSFAADATNSKCWHNAKLQAATLETCFLPDPGRNEKKSGAGLQSCRPGLNQTVSFSSRLTASNKPQRDGLIDARSVLGTPVVQVSNLRLIDGHHVQVKLAPHLTSHV